MSRIHEALKKAEQEKAATFRQEGPAKPAELSGAKTAGGAGAARAAVGDGPTPSAGEFAKLLEQLTFEELLARCPQSRWNPDPKKSVLLGSQNHTLGSEEFRTLRSRLHQIRSSQPLQKLLVTSALPQEGKTFIAANLSQAIVRQHERRVLLIDADLRWSRLHLALGTHSTPGLTDYLRGEADELAILQRGPGDNLFFVAGGKAVSNPAELIANGRLKTLFNRLSPFFDWIILDSPPAVAMSDASMLADFCDGVLLVVQAAVTPFHLAQKACQQFRNKHLVGAVLNRAEPGSTYSSYYYGYYKRDEKEKGKG